MQAAARAAAVQAIGIASRFTRKLVGGTVGPGIGFGRVLSEGVPLRQADSGRSRGVAVDMSMDMPDPSAGAAS